MDNENQIEEFRSLLLNTKREGMEDLLDYMEDCGFYSSPCSGGYHLSVKGGLLTHSLNVYNLAMRVAEALVGKDEVTEELKESITISSLLHDLGKMGQFEKPNYVPNILKSGKPSEAKPFKTNPDLLYIDHEIRSVAIASMFIDLTEDEQFAILYHNGLYGNLKYAISGHETPLYLIIHTADMWAGRILEVMEDEKED